MPWLVFRGCPTHPALRVKAVLTMLMHPRAHGVFRSWPTHSGLGVKALHTVLMHQRARGVVVSHPLRMRRALGSNPSVSMPGSKGGRHLPRQTWAPLRSPGVMSRSRSEGSPGCDPPRWRENLRPPRRTLPAASPAEVGSPVLPLELFQKPQRGAAGPCPCPPSLHWRENFGPKLPCAVCTWCQECPHGRDASPGTWCSGITSASHAEGPGFKSQCVHS